MRLTFLGVRGSTPSPGHAFARYGGHTSCIAVAHGPSDPPRLALDAGTGLRGLTGLLGGSPYSGSIVLTHLHWDHTQGIPFFAAGDRPDARVEVYLPEQSRMSGRDLIARFMSPPAFPITPEGLQGSWSFTAVPPGQFGADGFEVTAVSVAHKGAPTFGYRVSAGPVSIGYVPDHAPARGVSAQTRAALAGVDVLVHDAQFLAHERQRAVDYGHSTVEEAVELAEQLGARRLVLFHHAPMRTDAEMDELAAGLSDPDIVVAREGLVLDVG